MGKNMNTKLFLILLVTIFTVPFVAGKISGAAISAEDTLRFTQLVE
jgi:hypothetical protein